VGATAKELPSQEYLASIFQYVDGKLLWKIDHNKRRGRAKAGDEVKGTYSSCGYHYIMIKGEVYKLSRLVYQLVHGNLTPDLVVDHINRNRGDNTIENLRAIPAKHNARNCKIASNNSTGVTGVHCAIYKYSRSDGTIGEYLYYSAHWQDSSGRLRSKKFNVRKYGDAEAFRLACEYRKLKIQELIDSGEWYDPLHGI